MGERGSETGWPGAGPATPTIDGAPSPDPATAQRYAAWAERMRAKRVRDQARIAGGDAEAGTGGPGYWAADDVMGNGQPAGVIGTADRIECLGVLGLDLAATTDDISTSYRALAKTHHPDRWASADDAVQQEHAEAMMRINAAYRALRV